MKTKIAIACDDVGFDRKEEIKKYLEEEKNADVVYDPVKRKEDGFNNFARLADEMAGVIQRDECRLGIYICGTGIGFTCQINKHWGSVQSPSPTPTQPSEQDSVTMLR